MARSQYKNRVIFASAELNQNNGQWKPLVSIFWINTTQKFHSISDILGSFETEREAVDFAFKAGKVWIDSQSPVPPPKGSFAHDKSTEWAGIATQDVIRFIPKPRH